MNRLTKQWGNNPPVPTGFDQDFILDMEPEQLQGYNALLQRLSDYEDIGLTPDEIKSLAAIDGCLAMNTDQCAHKIFRALPPRRASGSICPNCGEVLQTAYHEERLYSVKCVRCQTVTLVKARNPGEAASKVGYQIKEDSP